LSLNLLKQDKVQKCGIKSKQLNAAWDHFIPAQVSRSLEAFALTGSPSVELLAERGGFGKNPALFFSTPTDR